MRQATGILTRSTRGRGFSNLTPALADFVAGSGIATGLLTLFLQHTSASLIVQENADPDVLADLERFFRRVVPEEPGLYRHADEGPDDMPAHIRAALTQTQLSIPVLGGVLALGTWQAVYLVEHRHAGHTRRVALHLLGE